MKLFTITNIFAMASLATMPVVGYSVQPVKRQVSCPDIGYYFKLVNTALFSVNYVQNFVHPCDLSLIQYFESQGLDGVYALDLICLYDAGTPLFNQSLSVVNDNLIVTLIGLFDAAASNNDPSRNLSCARLNTDILEALELDATVIKNIICDFTPCTVPTSSSSMSVVSTSRAVSSSAMSSVSRSSSVSGSGSATSSIGSTGSSSSIATTSSIASSSSVLPTLPPYTYYK